MIHSKALSRKKCKPLWYDVQFIHLKVNWNNNGTWCKAKLSPLINDYPSLVYLCCSVVTVILNFIYFLNSYFYDWGCLDKNKLLWSVNYLYWTGRTNTRHAHIATHTCLNFMQMKTTREHYQGGWKSISSRWSYTTNRCPVVVNLIRHHETIE